jgi:hypothetical protein
LLSETRYDVEGENSRTSSWTNSAKGYHPKESVRELKLNEGSTSAVPQYEDWPKGMTKMARDYHNSIQEKDVPDKYGRVLDTKITLEDDRRR